MFFRNAVTADVLNDEKVEEGREEECERERECNFRRAVMWKLEIGKQ